MARKCFFSFHYLPDCVRASQVREIGTIEGNSPARDNDWETIIGGGDDAIKRWIAGQMEGKRMRLKCELRTGPKASSSGPEPRVTRSSACSRADSDAGMTGSPSTLRRRPGFAGFVADRPPSRR